MKKVAHKTYLETLRARQDNKRISQEFQQAGLDIAEVLQDTRHKELSIKFAKEYDFRALFRLAKDVAERPGVRNKGAYFTKLFHQKLQEGEFRKISNS